MKPDSAYVLFFLRTFCGIAASVVMVFVAAGLASGCGGAGGPDGGDPQSGFVVDRPECTGTWGGGAVTGAGGTTIAVTTGKVPPCANINGAPELVAVASLPAGFPYDESRESVLTVGGDAVAVDGLGRGIDVDAEGSVTITMGYEPIKLPSESPVETSTNTFIRIWDPATGMAHDVNGHLDVDAQTVTVELPGLPAGATMAVVNRPARVAVTTSDPVFVSMPVGRAATPFGTWAGRDWCVIHDYDSAELRDAVRAVEGLGFDPEPAQIAHTVRARVAQAGRDAQAVYESLGLRAPWLYVSDDPEGPCGDVLGATPRYEIHVIDQVGSHYMPEDVQEATGVDGARYGRIYIRSRRVGDGPATVLGTVKASVAHEMVHAIQKGYEILGNTVQGLNEGTATVAGLYLDKGTIGVRSMDGSETFRMPWYLMVFDDGFSYTNQDFFAFVAKRIGGSSLAFLPVTFQAMRDAISSEMSGYTAQADMDAVRANPGVFVVHKALDAAINQVVPGMGLSDMYKDFVTQRLFYHGPESIFGRDGETTYGFAAELYPPSTASWGSIQDVTSSMDQCVMSDNSVKIASLCPFQTSAIRIRATDVPSPERLGDLEISLTSGAGDVITAWVWRNDQLQTVDGATVIADFGTFDGDEIDIVVANAGLADKCSGAVTVGLSLSCDDEKPDGEDPMECGSQAGVMACNKAPSLYYWNRSCEEYTGTHWYADPTGLPGMCTITTDAEWCTTGCARDHVSGTCAMSMGDNAEVIYYFYDTVEYDPADIDPAAWCGENGGSWIGV